VDIKRCKKCGKQFISKFETCPDCDAQGNRSRSRKIIFFAIVILALIHLLLFFSRQYDSAKSPDPPAREAEAEHTIFIENIEQHYQKLVESFNKRDVGMVIDELILFRKYDRFNYKGVVQIKDKIVLYLEEKVHGLPVSRSLDNLKIYRQLLKLEPDNPRYQYKVSFYEDRIKSKTEGKRNG
jgi:hypothetical protein